MHSERAKRSTRCDQPRKCPKVMFYCVNTSYPMDNCFTGRRDRSRQTSEKDVLYRIPAGPGECIRQVAHRTSSSCLDIMTSSIFFVWRVESEDVFSRQANFLFYTEYIHFISTFKKFYSIIYDYVFSRTKTRFLRSCYG